MNECDVKSSRFGEVKDFILFGCESQTFTFYSSKCGWIGRSFTCVLRKREKVGLEKKLSVHFLSFFVHRAVPFRRQGLFSLRKRLRWRFGLVSSYTGVNFHREIFWSLLQKRFERLNSSPTAGMLMANWRGRVPDAAFLCFLLSELLKRKKRHTTTTENQEKWEKWWVFLRTASASPCGPQRKLPGRAEAIFPISILYLSLRFFSF